MLRALAVARVYQLQTVSVLVWHLGFWGLFRGSVNARTLSGGVVVGCWGVAVGLSWLTNHVQRRRNWVFWPNLPQGTQRFLLSWKWSDDNIAPSPSVLSLSYLGGRKGGRKGWRKVEERTHKVAKVGLHTLFKMPRKCKATHSSSQRINRTQSPYTGADSRRTPELIML